MTARRTTRANARGTAAPLTSEDGPPAGRRHPDQAPWTCRFHVDEDLICVGVETNDESAAREGLAGSPAAAWSGRCFHEFVVASERDAVRETLRAALDVSASANLRAFVELPFEGEGGSEFELVVSPLDSPDEKGAVARIDCRKATSSTLLEPPVSTAPRSEESTSGMSEDRDTGAHEVERVMLVRRVELESLIAELTRRFLAAKPERLEPIIDESLRKIGQALSALRVRMICLGQEDGEEPSTYEYDCSVGGSCSPFTQSEQENYPWCHRRLSEDEVVEVANVAALPPAAEIDRRTFEKRGVASVLAVAAVEQGRVVGVLSVQGDTVVESFPEDEKRLLRVLAELFEGALRRRRSELKLRTSEERFRALAENMRDSICELNEAGRILYASPSYADLMGIEGSDFRGTDPLDQVHPEDRGRVAQLFRPGARSRRKGTLVYRAHSMSGRPLSLESTARAFEGTDGRSRVVVATRDVTEREHAQATLNRQLELQSRVAELSRFFVDIGIDEIGEGIESRLAVLGELADADHSWIYSFAKGSDGYLDFFDWWRESEDGHRPVAPENSVENFPYATGLITSGEVYHVPDVDSLPEEAARERADMASRGVCSVLGLPIMSGGKFVGCLGFESFGRETDWSEETIVLLRMAGEIFYSTLRRRRAGHDLRDSRSQLLQAQKMEAVGTLAGGIAHDFNNHLAVMLGNARFVRQEVDAAPEVIEAIEDFERSADHCAQLTRSLLAFSRRSPVEVVPVPVGEIVCGVQELIRPLLPRDIDLHVATTPDVGEFAVDRVQIQQVLVNLLVNARDAMPAGGTIRLEAVRRRLEAEEAARGGLSSARTYVVLSVEDSGVGMDEDTMARVFEPFYTTKPMGEGTGLGLAMAYGIVQQGQGAITVESDRSGGTTFRVYLPACSDQALSEVTSFQG